MGRKPKVIEETDVDQQAQVKQKKECSPELLERLKMMRIKAEQARKEKAKLNQKSKFNKLIKLEVLKKEGDEFDKTVEKLVTKPAPQPAPQPAEEPQEPPAAMPKASKLVKKKKKIIIEESDDDEESEEEIVVRKVKREPRYPRHSSENEEFGRLTRNAINEKLREKVHQERLNYVSDLLRPSYF